MHSKSVHCGYLLCPHAVLRILHVVTLCTFAAGYGVRFCEILVAVPAPLVLWVLPLAKFIAFVCAPAICASRCLWCGPSESWLHTAVCEKCSAVVSLHPRCKVPVGRASQSRFCSVAVLTPSASACLQIHSWHSVVSTSAQRCLHFPRCIGLSPS